MLEPEVVERLATAIRRRNLLLFVGTGLTIQATGRHDLTWRAVLERGIVAAERARRVTAERARRYIRDLNEADADPDDLLNVAEAITNKLQTPNNAPWRRWVSETFGELKAKDTAIIDAITRLAALEVPIVSTNYDDLLTGKIGRQCVTTGQPGLVAEAIRGDLVNATVHLHGHWATPDSIVLGVRSYDKLIAGKFSQSLLDAIAMTKTILFVGCNDGLRDPNVGRLFAWMREHVPDARYQHFRLVRATDAACSIEQHPAGDLTKIAVYGSDYAELPGALLQIADAASPNVPTAAPVMRQVTGNVFRPERCIGQSEVVQTACHLFTSQARALLLLLGALGIGKTNVALEIGGSEMAVQRFRDRRWIIRLETAGDAAAAVKEIASTIGIVSPTVDAYDLRTRLGEEPSLLILDGFETPWDGPDRRGVENLLTQLAQAEKLSIIVTKRGVMPPEGVRWDSTTDLQPLGPEDAARLFSEIAGSPPSGPGLDLDGLPLAIRLVAYRGRDCSLAELQRMWRKLGSALAKHPDREKEKGASLDAAIQLAFESPKLRPDSGRALFSLLGQLPSGISPEDRDVFLGDHGFDAYEELRDAGLAQRRGDRLVLLLPIREHAKRNHPPQDDLVRWYTHYLELVSTLGRRLGRADGAEALARLGPELPNIDAAIRKAVEERELIDAEAVARGYGRLLRFAGPGSVEPLESLANAVLETTSLSPADLNAVGMCWAQFAHVVLERSEHDNARWAYRFALSHYVRSENSIGRARCFAGLADIALVLSSNAEAKQSYEDALELYGSARPKGSAACLKGLGDVALKAGDFGTASEFYRRAMDCYVGVADPFGEAACLQALGEAERRWSQLGNAVAKLERAALLYRQVGALRGEAHVLRSLADISREQTRLDAAHTRYVAAQTLFTQLGDSRGEATCMEGLGHLAFARWELVGATQTFLKTLARYQHQDDKAGQAACLKHLGDIKREQSAFEEAEHYYRAAMAVEMTGGELDLHQANCQKGLGDLELSRDNLHQAGLFYDAAMELYRKSGNTRGLANCIKSQGDLQLRLQRLEEAVSLYEEALALHEQIEDDLGRANCWKGLGDIALARDEPSDAKRLFEAALPLYKRAKAGMGVANCEQRLGDVAYRLNDGVTAQSWWTKVLPTFKAGSDPYALGWAHHRLASVTMGKAREKHIRSARAAWASIGRLDLAAHLS